MLVHNLQNSRIPTACDCGSLLQCFACECGQNEACFVNLLVVVAAEFLFLLRAPSSQWLLDISIGILAANHETNLARRVCGNGSVGILNDREDFLAFFLELGNEWQVEPLILGLGSNNTTVFQGSIEKLKVRFLEQRLCWTFWVTAISDNDIEFVLAVSKELEAVSNEGFDSWVLVSNGHSREIFLADANDSFVDVAKNGFLDRLVFDHLTENTAVTTANNEDRLWVWVRVHSQVCDHLLIGELVPLSALNDIVKDKDGAVVAAFKDQNVLVFGLFVVEDLIDLEDHCLAWPHIGDLPEPAILDGGMSDFGHFEGMTS